jgi:hypothetical protein
VAVDGVLPLDVDRGVAEELVELLDLNFVEILVLLDEL